MEKEYKRLPEAEMDIMNFIWESKKAVSSVDIQEGLKGKHDWSLAVILNLLARLTERGFVTAEKQGKYKYYSALVKQEDYLRQESKSIIYRIFGGSVSKLVSCLYDGKNLSDEDIKSLKAFIDEKTDSNKE
ncbi:MAG: BlaI/MecI/CopY family transcriptional regulator [Oscillospiraceae bacterium]|nr:BlaI/MecI/CopY family transcriptional regulator [Oscillospiraceae bacterium]